MSEAKPNTALVLDGLKDFQRRTVDYVFQRLYTDPDANRRFLIADEVGLGKTQCARGVIARAVDHLWDKTERLDIIYICSNAEIARQNIERLNITGQPDFTLASRLTLLPLHIKDLSSRRINFVSFTPGTAFEQKSSMGISQERALVHTLIQKAWNFKTSGASLHVLRGNASIERFEETAKWFDVAQIDQGIADQFITEIAGRKDLKKEFEYLCGIYCRHDARVDAADWYRRRDLINDLRLELASQSLLALEPDLIILDEFQRFKDLLVKDDEASRLARKLFEYKNARVLLLSATPYKMLSLHHEREDDHYNDFLKTVSFLKSEADPALFPSLIRAYRQALFNLGEKGDIESLRKAKEALEHQLRKIIARTERLAVTDNRDGMLVEKIDQNLRFEAKDVTAFVGMQQVASRLEQRGMIEYWKSAPYLLNFMDGYELKKVLKERMQDPEGRRSLASSLKRFPEMVLPHDRIVRYKAVDERHPRLRSLLDDTVRVGAWKLLWIPPALPYYQMSGPFAEPALAGFTKRLIFSSWQVAPKAIACMTSYAVEREIMRGYEKHAQNTPESRKRHRPLLRFGFSGGRLTGMPVLSLIYPCLTLARQCSPRKSAAFGEGGLLSSEDVTRDFEIQIAKLLSEIPNPVAPTSREDEEWYWAAPILLDLINYPKETLDWWRRPELAATWGAEDKKSGNPDEESRWTDHVNRVRLLIGEWQDGKCLLGPQPKDLARILAKIACGGIGVALLRSLVAGDSALSLTMLDAIAKTAKTMLGVFNTPEAMALIRGMDSDEPYWLRVLEYSIAGCMQSMLDEYVHFLRDGIGQGKSMDLATRGICAELEHVTATRTSGLGVEHFDLTPGERSIEAEVRTEKMRAKFAMRLAADKDDETDNEVTRSDRVRKSFNSPFWPFILATTSVGQEGLDFHPYCHAVVHWNLPSNPVDLEQREGRVHRYKGHAVRKNLATKYGEMALKAGGFDPWEKLFDLGKINRSSTDTDIVPYWVFNGPAQIERRIPALPFSREIDRISQLRKALSIYRMVFGQNRQEDLLAYLEKAIPAADIDRVRAQVTLDLGPRISPQLRI